jgi:phosphate starvation-inducible PhoH-like protein
MFDIEVVPLHFMRGRTFHNAFVILDEAQNCSMKDFKLFLTRIGRHSRVVVEGDSTQKDKYNGALPEVLARLEGMEGVGTVRMEPSDIIRNPMLWEIIKRLDSSS